jgi:RNA 2',3'-cyclic 3'-phosphodiesterase
MDDIFFAVLPDLEAKARIARLAQEHGLPGSAVAPARLHVSLHWVGDHATPADATEAAKRAAAAVDMACFRIAFDRVQSSSGRQQIPIVLAGGDELVGLLMLREMLADRLKCRVKSGFTPHLTFLYSDHEIPELVITPISWIVRELVLLRSRRTQDYHDQLGRGALPKGAIG